MKEMVYVGLVCEDALRVQKQLTQIDEPSMPTQAKRSSIIHRADEWPSLALQWHEVAPSEGTFMKM